MTLVYWCRTCGRGGPNFGDALGPRLLETVGVRAEWAAPPQAKLVTAGSVLGKFKPNWRGVVWGTGFIEEGPRHRVPSARVLSVRGELTRERAGLPSSTPLGDPGVLSGDLAPAYAGVMSGRDVIVPHYVDHEMEQRHPDALVGDIDGDAKELLGLIAGADIVFTSSLHALIAADALGVPHVWEPCERVTGGAFKFNDYLSAFGETIKPGVERMTPRFLMNEKKAEARAQLQELGRLFG